MSDFQTFFSTRSVTAQPRIYTWEARRAFFHLENAHGRYGCMKDSLCPKNSSLKDDSNDTKNETENRILPSVVLQQSFVNNIGEFPGSQGMFLKTHPVVKGLMLG